MRRLPPRLRAGERVWYSDPSDKPARIFVVERVNECAAYLVPEARKLKSITAKTKKVRINGRVRVVPLDQPETVEIAQQPRLIPVSPYASMERVKEGETAP